MAFKFRKSHHELTSTEMHPSTHLEAGTEAREATLSCALGIGTKSLSRASAPVTLNMCIACRGPLTECSVAATPGSDDSKYMGHHAGWPVGFLQKPNNSALVSPRCKLFCGKKFMATHARMREWAASRWVRTIRPVGSFALPAKSRTFRPEPTTKRKYMQVTNPSWAVSCHDPGVFVLGIIRLAWRLRCLV